MFSFDPIEIPGSSEYKRARLLFQGHKIVEESSILMFGRSYPCLPKLLQCVLGNNSVCQGLSTAIVRGSSLRYAEARQIRPKDHNLRLALTAILTELYVK